MRLGKVRVLWNASLLLLGISTTLSIIRNYSLQPSSIFVMHLIFTLLTILTLITHLLLFQVPSKFCNILSALFNFKKFVFFPLFESSNTCSTSLRVAVLLSQPNTVQCIHIYTIKHISLFDQKGLLILMIWSYSLQISLLISLLKIVTLF